MNTITKNEKTIKSIDCDTICPKRKSGKSCRYCYVETARRNKWNSKHLAEFTEYKGVNFRQETIDKLNSVGGIRLFSFSDYKPEHDEKLNKILDDCLAKGLKVKAITKQVEFIEKYHNHPAISVIHVSVDNVGDGVDLKTAKRLRKKYDTVIIRSVILKDEDLDILAKVSDIVTFNHGNNGFVNYSKQVERMQALIKKFRLEGKVCCSTEKCISCDVKCKAA